MVHFWHLTLVPYHDSAHARLLTRYRGRHMEKGAPTVEFLFSYIKRWILVIYYADDAYKYVLVLVNVCLCFRRRTTAIAK